MSDDPHADDEIVAEIRRIRAQIQAEFGEDRERYLDHLQEVKRWDIARGAVYLDQPLRPAHRPRPDAA